MNFQGVPILKNYDVIRKVHFSVGVERISHKKWLNLEFLGVKLFTKIKNYSVNCHSGGHVMIMWLFLPASCKTQVVFPEM